MKRIRLAIIFILLSSVVSSAVSPHPFYGRFSSWDGLPDNTVASVCQDGFGRIWAATREGVYYYTGERFTPFNNADYLAGCSANTFSIKLDAEGCVWTGSIDGVGFYDIFSDSFTVLEGLQEIPIRDIELTADGNVWLISPEGIWKYDKQSGELERAITDAAVSPSRACVTGNGNLAFTAGDNRIYLLNAGSGSIKAIESDRQNASFNHIEYVGENKVLISDGANEICLADLGTGNTAVLLDADVYHNQTEVQCLLYDEGLYWIGTSNGLLIFDPLSRYTEVQFPNESNSASLGGESVHCLFSDINGNVWAGTRNGGLRFTHHTGFSRFVSRGTLNSLKGSNIRAVSEGPDGNIWIGSEEGYLSRMNPDTYTFDDFTSVAGIAPGTRITDITRIGSLLWITAFGEGIIAFDPVRGRTVHRYSLADNDCMAIMQASDGELYAGARHGLFRLDKASDSFILMDDLGTPFVHSLVEDRYRHLIISTYLHGFGIYDIPTSSYTNIEDEAQHDAITSFTLDSKGVIWATTNGSGLCRIEIAPDGKPVSVKHFDKQSGMPSNSCCSVTEDADGHLWVATTMGLALFDPVKEKVIKTYMQADNVIGRHFTFGSNYKSSDGQIFLGTTEGLLEFTPESVKDRFAHSVIHITDITLGSSSGNTTISQQGRSQISSQAIRIRQKDAGFMSITFSSMDYSSPNVERYESSLVGRKQKNYLVTDENHIDYTGLKPGSYRFTVNFENSEDNSTAAGLDIAVLAPWYLSNFAKILYVLLLIMAAYLLLKHRKRRKEEEAKRRRELVEANKEKDLAHEKMAFFTNIAHEIRTPVSVLQILLDKTDSERKVSEIARDDMKAMHLNVDRLKKLCDDLLDFRKMDNGQVPLVFAPEDVCAIMRKSINSFTSAAKARNLEINVEYSMDVIISSCDADAIESVICNLLSNAIKHSDSRIECKLSEKDGNAVIRVENDGAHIPEKESNLIFEAFYQSKAIEKNGTGLGLTYSRKIASLHNGKLYLDTAVKDMNSFVLEIPLYSAQAEPSENSLSDSTEEDAPDQPSQNATVLVVEDNDMMRDLIRDSLAMDYTILTACDGEEALEIVKSSHVDLVVSDIMMPRMDGCELCNAIKEDISLSHIPVLLLTAAVGVETHIRSLKSGADAYIEKPFKMDILKAYISNLFRNRDIRNEQFSSSPLSHYNFSSVSKVEQDFMNTLHTFIMDHLSETDLTIDRLANVMAVSRATLTRKVKANTGETVNEYVRVCRLKKAVELLAENSYRINEIAYLVGFSSPSYFTSSFQKQFGKLPSEFIKKKTK